MKKCTKCLKRKKESKFYEGRPDCKACKKAATIKQRVDNGEAIRAAARARHAANPEIRCKQARDWVKANPDKIKALNRAGYEKNREQRVAKAIEWNKANPEKAKAAIRAWEIANPGRVNAKHARRRAARFNAMPSWLTKDQMKQMDWFYKTAKELQWLSDEPLEVDHIEPLQGETSCGLHVPWNLRIVPRSVNRAKKNRLPPRS